MNTCSMTVIYKTGMKDSGMEENQLRTIWGIDDPCVVKMTIKDTVKDIVFTPSQKR